MGPAKAPVSAEPGANITFVSFCRYVRCFGRDVVIQQKQALNRGAKASVGAEPSDGIACMSLFVCFCRLRSATLHTRVWQPIL